MDLSRNGVFLLATNMEEILARPLLSVLSLLGVLVFPE